MASRLYTACGAASAGDTLRALSSIRLELRDDVRTKRLVLDTFDRSLLHANRVVEADVQPKKGCALRLRYLDSGEVISELSLGELPRFSWDLPNGGLKRHLEPLLDVRALLPLAQARGRVVRLEQRDKEGKIVLRAELWCPTASGAKATGPLTSAYVQILPVRGYDKAFARARAKLEEELGFAALAYDPLRVPEPSSATRTAAIEPGMRADMACKRVFADLFETMRLNEDGMRADIDSEFLHDYRVALRRTRTLLTQLKGVFPQARVKSFAADFRWLGEVTGAARDADVYLLSFEDYRQVLPAHVRDDLYPLRDELVALKSERRRVLLSALDSARYRKLLRRWQTFIESPAPQRSRLAGSERPIIEVVSRRIRRVHRESLKEGRSIGSSSAPEHLHELRKTCKKLRYLVELFRPLFKQARVVPVVKMLKRLQDNLGTYNDLQVQRLAMAEIQQNMVERGIHSAAPLLAVALLGEQLQLREQVTRQAFQACFARYDSAKHRRAVDTLLASAKDFAQ